MDQLLTVKEAAKVLRCHHETLYKRLGTDKAPTFVRQGKRIFIREVAIKEFLDRNEQVF